MIPAWKLERYALGELPEAELATIRAQLDADPEARATLEELAASDAAILAQRPPAAFAAGCGPSGSAPLRLHAHTPADACSAGA